MLAASVLDEFPQFYVFWWKAVIDFQKKKAGMFADEFPQFYVIWWRTVIDCILNAIVMVVFFFFRRRGRRLRRVLRRVFHKTWINRVQSAEKNMIVDLDESTVCADRSWFVRRGRPKAVYVRERRTGLISQEKIAASVNLVMRLVFQSPFSWAWLTIDRMAQLMKKATEAAGRSMDDPSSVADIPHTIAEFNIDMSEFEVPPAGFRTFNEWFARKLRPGARPIAAAGDPSVIVSSADCRLVVFPTIDAATRVWIKGRNFSVRGMLGLPPAGAAPRHDRPRLPSAATARLTALAQRYEAGGSIVVFRLAPQDYHRFHSPVSGVLGARVPLVGEYVTVNPVAINSLDVFTENKRVVTSVETREFGTVALIAVGASMVASIQWSADEGATINKGDELGYFQFGGSTVIALFEPGVVTFDQDLVEDSLKPVETLIRMGDRIGVCSRA